MLRRVAVALIALAAVAPSGVAQAAADADIRSDAEWILDNRAPDGAITTGYPFNKVVPYQANFAAMGLARATRITGDTRYADAAFAWLLWYRNRALESNPMDPNRGSGIVYNYERSGSSGWTTKYELDSSDSYAGTYLIAVKEWLLASGNVPRLGNLAAGIDKALDAIEYTEHNGLHFAKPGWPFKYTMDEAETYEGLLAAADLGLFLADSALRSRAQADAAALLQASGELWDPSTNLFLWARHADGTAVPAPLDWLYPGASVQAWAVAHGLATGDRAEELMNRYAEAQPDWDDPIAQAQYYNGVHAVEYWPHVALAFLRAGQIDRACTGVRSIQAAALAAERAYPFTPGHAGQIILVMSDSAMLARSLTGC